MNFHDFPDKLEKNLDMDVNGNYVEESKFVVLSFVGDKTYSSLIDQMKENPKNIATNGGIKNLLNNLHSAFYSEDPRLCDILNTHFKHYFNKEKSTYFPDIAPNLWENNSIIRI